MSSHLNSSLLLQPESPRGSLGKVLNQSWQQVEAGGDPDLLPTLSLQSLSRREVTCWSRLPSCSRLPRHVLPFNLSKAVSRLGFSRDLQCIIQTYPGGDGGLSQRKAGPSSLFWWGRSETISHCFLGDALESVSSDKTSCIPFVHVRCRKAPLLPAFLLLQLQSLLEQKASLPDFLPPPCRDSTLVGGLCPEAKCPILPLTPSWAYRQHSG